MSASKMEQETDRGLGAGASTDVVNKRLSPEVEVL